MKQMRNYNYSIFCSVCDPWTGSMTQLSLASDIFLALVALQLAFFIQNKYFSPTSS